MNPREHVPTTVLSPRTFVLVLLVMLLSGCAVFEDLTVTEPTEDEDKPPAEEPTVTREDDCDWQEVRGVAELVEVLNGDGRFVFYPGEETVTQARQEHWEIGDEFTALLKVETENRCDPQMDIKQELE